MCPRLWTAFMRAWMNTHVHAPGMFASASTSSGMPLRSSATSVIASLVHWLSHTPQPMHCAQLMAACPLTVIASKGQTSSQVPQAEQARLLLDAP